MKARKHESKKHKRSKGKKEADRARGLSTGWRGGESRYLMSVAAKRGPDWREPGLVEDLRREKEKIADKEHTKGGKERRGGIAKKERSNKGR